MTSTWCRSLRQLMFQEILASIICMFLVNKISRLCIIRAIFKHFTLLQKGRHNSSRSVSYFFFFLPLSLIFFLPRGGWDWVKRRHLTVSYEHQLLHVGLECRFRLYFKKNYCFTILEKKTLLKYATSFSLGANNQVKTHWVLYPLSFKML